MSPHAAAVGIQVFSPRRGANQSVSKIEFLKRHCAIALRVSRQRLEATRASAAPWPRARAADV